MKKEIRIDSNYWNSLNEKEQRFLQENVYQHGIANCKKVIQLARKHVPDSWNDLVNASVYVSEKGAEYNWIVLKDSKVIANIFVHSKTKRVHVMENHKLVTVYSNI